jgi:hypothetical protein
MLTQIASVGVMVAMHSLIAADGCFLNYLAFKYFGFERTCT